ncbi:hypothetical protein Cob_v003316 [Colletotrichum orbiculare MAFF 240422]|uniref:Uncharacterized protein n=1 Tax=Colletotrichum orbiculare (strain 104-T / ATCC 96160 / CBS 514.97 / LARS 414 / MAFF 240422) TaxID=1213857 RepID=A0A484G178_COLOR|nr:hypothetical protein Cob_v003316 [Colletotrichum orbiculare MAFF 240422]
MVATFVVAFSAVFGMAEAIRHTQSQARRKEHRSRKNNLLIRCRKSTRYSPDIEGKHVVLSGDKLFVDTGLDPDSAFGFPFTGYFLPYPEAQHEGLVSMICEEPPIMNWIYVDRDTHEVKQDKRLTFAGWEGFYVVKTGDFWALYFDVEQDGLKAKLGEDITALAVDLVRVEMPVMPVKEEEKEGRQQEPAEGKDNNTNAEGNEVDFEAPEVD